MRHSFRNTYGFTLLEIVITAVIIGVLASIALPRYQDFTETQRAIRTANNLRAIHNAILEYKANAVMQNDQGQTASTTGSVLPPGMFQTLEEINKTLHLNITGDDTFRYMAGNDIVFAYNTKRRPPKDYMLFACPSAGFSPIGSVTCPHEGDVICVPNMPFSNRCPRGLSPDVIVTEENFDKVEACIIAYRNIDLSNYEMSIEELCEAIYGED